MEMKTIDIYLVIFCVVRIQKMALYRMHGE